MKRYCAIIVFLFIAVISLPDPLFALSETEEYEDITLYYARPKTDSLSWNETAIAQIRRYKEFLKKYPDSRLASSAKLRIAELYSLITPVNVDSYLAEKRKEFLRLNPNASTDDIIAEDRRIMENIPMELINENFRDEIRRWLDDIIQNHAGAEHYTLKHFQFSFDGEKTAALALYYRGHEINLLVF